MMLSSIFHSRNLWDRLCRRVLLTLLCLLVLSGCDLWKFGGDDPKNYRTGEGIDIIDSHYWANSVEELYWANESTVLFTGFESGRYVHYEPGHPDKPNYYVVLWDMQRDKFYRPNMTKPYRVILCRTDEYYVVSAGTYKGHEGTYLMKLVQEGEEYQLVEIGRYSSDEIAAYPAECLFKVSDPPVVGEYELHRKIPKTDFYLAKRTTSFGNHLFSEEKTRIDELDDLELEPATLSFSEFNKTFSLLAWNEKNSQYSLVLLAQESFTITALPHHSEPSKIRYFGAKLTKLGVVFRDTLVMSGEKIHGLFLWRGQGDAELLIEGIPGKVAVYPSGCKLAFSHAPAAKFMGWKADNSESLKIIDLCSKE